MYPDNLDDEEKERQKILDDCPLDYQAFAYKGQIKYRANIVKDDIILDTGEIKQAIRERHKDVMTGIDFDSDATKKDFHNLVGDGKTGIDKFLETGKTAHYEKQGKRIKAAHADSKEPVEAGRWQYKILNENEQGDGRSMD